METENTTNQEPVTSPIRIIAGSPIILAGILTAYIPLLVSIPNIKILGLSISITVIPALLLLLTGGTIVSGLDNIIKNKIK